MYKVFMFNTVQSEENHDTANGHGQLTGWHPPASGNIPSLTIAFDMHAHLAAKSTSNLEPLIRRKTLTPYTNGFIYFILPMVGDGNDACLDFTSFVAGFNANEWGLLNP